MDHYHEFKNMVSSSTYSYSRLGAGMRTRNSNDNDLTQVLRIKLLELYEKYDSGHYQWELISLHMLAVASRRT